MVASSLAGAQTLHTPGTEVSVTAQFGATFDTDSGLGSSSVSLVSPLAQGGDAFASAQYGGALRIEADSAPDGVGAVTGDSMVARATMVTLNRIDAMPGGPSAGTLVDIRMDYSLDGRMINIGNRSNSNGSIAYGIRVGRDTTNVTLLNGFLAYGPSSVNVNDFGLLDPVNVIDIATGNPFIDIGFSDSRTFQVRVGEEFTVQAILQAVSGGSMRASFLNTAGFSLVAITEGVQVSVIPVPEPSTAMLFVLGLAGLAGVRRR